MNTSRPSMLVRRSSCFLLLASCFLLLPGCGYSTKPTYQVSVKTVAVPIFQNKTNRREWEMRLTEALAKNIEARTPYKIAARGRADTVLTGTIVSIDEAVLSRRVGQNLPRESELAVVVDFTWKDVRTGRVLVERKSFARAATEIPQAGERVVDAEQWAVERTAAAIVDQMQYEKSWDDAEPARK